MGLFPPWNHKLYYRVGKSNIETYVGYGFIFSPPTPIQETRYWIPKLDVARLIFQWILVIIITIGLTVIFKDAEPGDNSQ